jgi:hypothetical protein
MSKKAHGQIRRSQVINTYGPGALIDLPRHSAIVGGLDTWPSLGKLQQVLEPRLTRKLQQLTDVPSPRLYLPPPDESEPGETPPGIGIWRFPEWFLVQEADSGEKNNLSRRLVPRTALDRGKFDGRDVVATRFVRACTKGHVDDLDFRYFVHGKDKACSRQLWLDEKGTSGDLGDLVVRCECKDSKSLGAAMDWENFALGGCSGRRPWLGRVPNQRCDLPSRLLTRTASNAYFPQVVSVMSLPDRGSAVQKVVAGLWDYLQIVMDMSELPMIRRNPKIMDALASFPDEEVFKAIELYRTGAVEDRPVKLVELDAILAAPEGFGEDTPIDPDFHARRLPDRNWRRSDVSKGVQGIFQLHRLREVTALMGFTRFESISPDINGEYETDVESADIAIEPSWFPAVENRGEGLFIQLNSDAIAGWLKKEAVIQRSRSLELGHLKWATRRKSKRNFPGAPYVLLHSLSHLLVQSLAMECGYPASSIRERIYSDPKDSRYGILLYTGSPDADGTLGGLVQQGRRFEGHLMHALRLGRLCSNDPICAHHISGESMEGRWLHGASCHGCSLIAETSCEMRNDYLDRALVVPVIGCEDAAFFPIEA